MKIESLLENSDKDEQIKLQAKLDVFAAKVKHQFGDLENFDLEATPQGDIRLGMIFVTPGRRKNGTGTKVMDLLTDYADSLGKRLVLGTESRNKEWGTTSKSRLVKFYRRFGFVPKKGRNMDYRMSIYDNMLRRAKEKNK
jgi:GNAT superfamily N-acetyltransferase